MHRNAENAHVNWMWQQLSFLRSKKQFTATKNELTNGEEEEIEKIEKKKSRH